MTAHNFDIVAADDAHASAPDFVQPPQRWIDRFPLSTKLNVSAISSALVLLIVAFVAIFTFLYYSNAGRHVADVAGLEVRTTHAVMDIDEAAMALHDYRDGGDRASLAAVGPALASAQENIEYTRGWISDQMPPETHDTVAAFDAELIALQSRWEGLSANLDPATAGSFEGDVMELRGDIAAYARTLRGTLAPAARDLFGGIEFVMLINVIFVVFAVTASFLAARYINRNVSGAVGEITHAMEEVAQGKIDTPLPGLDRQDEIGAMARALGVFRQYSLDLRDIDAQRARVAEAELAQQQLLTQQARDLRSRQSEVLTRLADGFEVSVGEVIAAVGTASSQLKDTSESMVELAEKSSNQSHEAAQAMEQTNGNVTAAAAATDEFALSIAEISKQATASAKLARQSSDLVDAANDKMTTLSSAADEIGEIASMIQTIAQRTNLLALNASIEAARGGEAGRGFAVVASEVKDLANQTSNATQSVAEKIAAMQNSTKASVADLTSIVSQIDELEQAAVVIASAVDQQSMSGEDLARNIDTVASGSAEVATKIEALHEASTATGAASSQVLDSVRALDRHSDALRAQANRFLSEIRESSVKIAADEAA